MDYKITGIKEFSEKIENIQVKDIIDIFYSKNPQTIYSKGNKLYINPNSEEAKKLHVTPDFCNKLYGILGYISIKIKYNEEDIPIFFKTIEIENSDGNREIHYIYRYQYCQKLIIDEKKFKNPLIEDNEKILDFSELEQVFSRAKDKFKIIDKEKIDYYKIFIKEEKKEMDKITGLDYSENFNYYFKYPNKNELFKYNYSTQRAKLINNGINEKIRGICGNFGIGKSTCLLAAKLEIKEIIYLNIKALMKNKDNLYRWKYEILLKEIAFSFKFTSNYDTFTKLKETIEKRTLIWESIIELVKFTINNSIRAKIILDQYKEAYDKDNRNIKEIIDLINKDKLNNVHLIISSSINNKDLRNSLLKLWFPNYNKKISNLFNYDYYDYLFDSKLLYKKTKIYQKLKKNILIIISIIFLYFIMI